MTILGRSYSLDLTKMLQINTATNISRNICHVSHHTPPPSGGTTPKVKTRVGPASKSIKKGVTSGGSTARQSQFASLHVQV